MRIREDQLPALAVGGTYRATVVGHAADGYVMLRFATGVVPARTDRQLAEGALVDVEVERLVPRVVLRIVRVV